MNNSTHIGSHTSKNWTKVENCLIEVELNLKFNWLDDVRICSQMIKFYLTNIDETGAWFPSTVPQVILVSRLKHHFKTRKADVNWLNCLKETRMNVCVSNVLMARLFICKSVVLASLLYVRPHEHSLSEHYGLLHDFHPVCHICQPFPCSISVWRDIKIIFTSPTLEWKLWFKTKSNYKIINCNKNKSKSRSSTYHKTTTIF